MSDKKIYRFGEKELQLIFAFEEQKQRIFTVKDAKGALGGSNASVRNVLKRLKAKNRIIRIERGKYLFAPMESGKEGTWSEDSFAAVPALVGEGDYYIGLLTALNYWEMTEQMPIVVYVVTRKKKKSLEAFGARYIFVNMKRGDCEQIEILGRKVNVSSREQTILDCLRHPKYSLGVSEVVKGISAVRRGLNWAKLVRLCLTEKETVRRRLGYLLELLGEVNCAKRLEKRFSGFAWLDPHAEKKRLGYSKKWGLIINVSRENLLEFKGGY